EGTMFTCPMHPDIRQVGPGSCPICGMALEPEEISLEDEGPNPELVDMSRRVKVAAVFSIPILVLTMGDMALGGAISNTIPTTLLNWLQLALASPVVIWAGWPLLEEGWQSLKSRHLNMFTLIALGV